MDQIKLFISYARSDRDYALQLVRLLDENDIDLFIDDNIRTGQKWKEVIQNNLLGCSHFILVVTPDSLQSDWVKRELWAALLNDKPIFPWMAVKLGSEDEIPFELEDIQFAESRDKLINDLEKALQRPIEPAPEPKGDKILVVGGANIENNYSIQGKFQIGAKQKSSYSESFGGGGLNIASRLGKYGLKVLPLLNYGEDSLGQKVFDFIEGNLDWYKNDRQMKKFWRETEFLVPKTHTNSSVIISDDEQRTIIYQDLNQPENETSGHSHPFQKHVKSMVDSIKSNGIYEEIGMVVIGHIKEDAYYEGQITKDLIAEFAEKDIFWLPGNTQINMKVGEKEGYDFWKEELENINYLQLNLLEMKAFLKNKKLTKDFDGTSNEDLLHSLLSFLNKDNFYSIITLDLLGSLATKPGTQQVFLSDIYVQKGSVDPTGSGDAFAAGFISEIQKYNTISNQTIIESMKVARAWGAYATLSMGGAQDLPSREEVERFTNDLNQNMEVGITKFDLKSTTLKSKLRDKEFAYFYMNGQ